jgi:hypothetical protein
MRNGTEKELSFEYAENNMNYEIQKFISFVESRADAESYNNCSMASMRIMDEARRQQGIIFPADAYR